MRVRHRRRIRNLAPRVPVPDVIYGSPSSDPYPDHTISEGGAFEHQSWAEALPGDTDPSKTAGWLKAAIRQYGDQGRGDVADLLGRFNQIDPEKAQRLQAELAREILLRSSLPSRYRPLPTSP